MNLSRAAAARAARQVVPLEPTLYTPHASTCRHCLSIPTYSAVPQDGTWVLSLLIGQALSSLRQLRAWGRWGFRQGYPVVSVQFCGSLNLKWGESHVPTRPGPSSFRKHSKTLGSSADSVDRVGLLYRNRDGERSQTIHQKKMRKIRRAAQALSLLLASF